MTYIYEGAISVKSALNSPYRDVQKIYMDEKKKSKDFGYILAVAKNQNVPVERIPREQLDTMAQGSTHGGVIAEVSERIYQKIEDFEYEKPLFLALVEGIEDPFNFGYILRTLYASGCDGVLVPVRNWTTEAGLIAKSSAGAFDAMPIVVVENFAEVCATLKEKGVHLYAAMREDAKEMYELNYQESCLIALGGPKRGLSAGVLEHVEQNFFIPYERNFRNSLNASAAIAVIAYEVYRQRRKIV